MYDEKVVRKHTFVFKRWPNSDLIMSIKHSATRKRL